MLFPSLKEPVTFTRKSWLSPCPILSPSKWSSGGACRPSWRDHGKLIGNVGAGANGPILQPRRQAQREGVCSLTFLCQPASLSAFDVRPSSPDPWLPSSPLPPPQAPVLLGSLPKAPRAEGQGLPRASRSAVTVSRCGTLSAQGVCVFTLQGPPRRMWLVRRARGVNILGGVAPGLGCCVHALVLFLLLVHPVVTTTQTCLRPPGALPPGGRPSTAEGSGQVHSHFTDETTKVHRDRAPCPGPAAGEPG